MSSDENELENEEPNDADIPDQEEEENRALCPRSGKAFFESGMAYTFAGYKDLTCWKEMSKRQVKPEEYADALQAAEEGSVPTILEGFISKKGKKFNAGIKPVRFAKEGEAEPEDYTKWAFAFAPDEVSEHKCPKSGEPITIRENTYVLAGFPEVAFWREMSQRKMSIPDILEIIEAGDEGVMFRGFTSGGGKNFDACVVFDGKEVKFNFPDKKEA